MKLQDLFPLIENNPVIYIFDEMAEVGTDKELAVYNGRDSIPSIYNDCTVTGIAPLPVYLDRFYPKEDGLLVVVDHESVLKAEKYKKANERDQWLYGEDYNPRFYSGGTRYFELTSDALEEAISLGFISPEQTHNDSPTVRELLAFAKKSEWDWSFEGYVVSPEREDTTKMSITAIYASDTEFTVEDVCKFAEAFRYADEFDVGPYCARAWWD